MATPSMNADQGDDMWQSRCFVLIMLRKLKITTNFARNKSGGGVRTAPLIIYSHLGCMIFFVLLSSSFNINLDLSQSVHPSIS